MSSEGKEQFKSKTKQILQHEITKYETRYDYNLTIMKSPKPATDTIYPDIKF